MLNKEISEPLLNKYVYGLIKKYHHTLTVTE